MTDDRQVTFEEQEHRALEAERRAKMAEKKIIDTASQILRLALDALSKRIFLFLALLASAGLFAWAMAEESVTRTLTAIAFSILVYLPALVVLKKELSDGD